MLIFLQSDLILSKRKPEEKENLDFFILEKVQDAQDCNDKDKANQDSFNNQISVVPKTSGRFSYGAKYGYSLNEAMLGPSTRQTTDHNFPNFDLLDQTEKCNQTSLQHVDLPSTSGLTKGFVKCSKLINENEYGSVPNATNPLEYKQTIFPTEVEHIFYSLLTYSISKNNFR